MKVKFRWEWLWRLVFGGTLFSILYLTTIPTPPNVGTNDKTEHFLAFAFLGLLARLGWPHLSYGKVWLPLLALYGAAIEVIQSFLPYRSAEFLDFLADFFGIVLVWWLSLLKRF